MVILLTKASARETRKCKVSDKALCEAVNRARTGLVDANLGATLIKQEVAQPPEGRKTACRAIVTIRPEGDLAVIMHVYAKSEKANLTRREADAYAELSKSIAGLTDSQISSLI